MPALRTGPTGWNATGSRAPSDLGRGPRFETGELAIQAALQGLGILVMDRFLIARELADGRLIDLFPESRAVDNGYFFFAAARRWDEPEIVLFRDWVLAEFGDRSHRV